MKRILISGVTGFIGKNLVRYWKDGHHYTLIGHSRDLDKARIALAGSARLIENISAKAIDEERIDVVIHLAGIAHDLSNTYKPEDYYRVNFGFTKSVFDEFVKSNASYFVFLSSIKAVTDRSLEPITESLTAHPITDYGKSKRQAEEYIQSVAISNHKRVYILRPAMIHGPGNKGNLNLLYRFAKSGFPYPLGAYENKRSFLSVDNLNFVIQSLIEKDISSGLFHVADDGYISTTKLFSLIRKQLNKKEMIWKLPKILIDFSFSLIGKKGILGKLTEDMMVSNTKIIQSIKEPLPVSMRNGLRSTIDSFSAK